MKGEESQFIDVLLWIMLVVAYFISQYYDVKRQPQGKKKRARTDEGASPTSLPSLPRTPQEHQPKHESRHERAVAKKTPLRMTTKADERFDFHASLDTFHQETAVEKRQLAISLRDPDQLVSEDLRIQQSEGQVHRQYKDVPIRALIRSLPRKRVLIVAAEVIGPPRGLRAYSHGESIISQVSGK